MGYMKDLDIRIRQGGDDAVAAACELAGVAKERRGYEDTMRATSEITDIVTVLRGVGFASVPPSAGESASLLHYCVTHAADEIEHLRKERRWIPVAESLPPLMTEVLGWHPADRVRAWFRHSGTVQGGPQEGTYWESWSPQDRECDDCNVDEPSHWQLLPSPPGETP
jgi:hypothetical protein